MTQPSANPQDSSSAPPQSRRAAITGVVLLVALIVVAVAAYLVLSGEDDDAASSASTLVLLDGTQLHHIDDDGDISATFELDVDTDSFDARLVIGSHIVAKLGAEVVAIDPTDGEVRRFETSDPSGDQYPVSIAGQTSLVAVGSPMGSDVLDIIDLRDGVHHRLGDAAGEGLYVTDTVRASPDGSKVGATNLGSEVDLPTVVISLSDGHRVELPGFLAGISHNRIMTSEADPDTGQLTFRWFDEAGEEAGRTSFDPPDAATAMPDGSLVYAVDGVLYRAREGDDPHEVLDGPDVPLDGSLSMVPVGSEGRMILASAEDVLLLDTNGQTLASGPAPSPLIFDRTRTGQRCFMVGFAGQPSVVFDIESGESLADGSEPVFAQSSDDGCTVVTGRSLDDGTEYTVSGTEVSHVVEPGVNVSAVSDDGRVVVRSPDGVFFLPLDGTGERTKVYESPVWLQFINLSR